MITTRMAKALADSKKESDRDVHASDADTALYAHHASVLKLWPRFLVLAIGIVYIVFESKWNITLTTAVSGGVEKDKLEGIVVAGRWLTAFGLVWAIGKGKILNPAPGPGFASNVAILIVSIVLLHTGLTYAFDMIIDSMSPQAVMMAHKASVYRYLNSGSKEMKDPTTAVLVPLMAFSANGRKKLDEVYSGATTRAELESEKMTEEVWPMVEKFKGAVAPEKLVAFEDGYKRYLSASQSLEHSAFKRFGIEKFKEATGGMEPNAQATRLDFARQLINSRMVERRMAAEKYMALQDQLQAAKDKIKAKLNGQQFDMDMSQLSGLKKDDLQGKFLAAAMRQIAASLPDVDQVKHSVEGRAGAQAAIIPLMAMVLSLAGVCANLGSVVGVLFGSARVIYPLVGLSIFMAIGFFAGSHPLIAQCEDLNQVLTHVLKSAVAIERLFV